MSFDLKDWYSVEAKKMGVSASALMVLALQQFKKGSDIEQRIDKIERVIGGKV